MRILSIPVLFFILLLSCNKKDAKPEDDNTTEKPGQIKGMGNSTEKPTGTPFTLPAGISLDGGVMRGFDLNVSDCRMQGTGHYVVVELKLKNTLGKDTLIEIPAGTIVEFTGQTITSVSHTYQHGILVEKEIISVPKESQVPGGAPCNVKLMLFCINASKEPSDPNALYKFGPVTDSKLMKEFISLVKNKKVSYDPSNIDYQYQSELLQEIIYNITDRETGITEENRAYIASLPNK